MSRSSLRDGLWYVLGAAGVIGGLVLIRRDAEHGFSRPVREGVLGGISVGAGLALLALLEAPKRLAGSAVVASIPYRSKTPAAA